MKAIQDAKIEFVPVTPVESRVKLYKHIGDLNKKISTRAYDIFERRGRVHGHDLDDWLKAEAEVGWEIH